MPSSFRIMLLVCLLFPPFSLVTAADPESDSRLIKAEYLGWEYSGSMFILTTPEGADLPSSASIEGFPLLVRIHEDFFDFGQAKASGEDVRFATPSGDPLPFQIEHWDADGGAAAIWVRIPRIKGNTRQEIRMFWGKADARGESDAVAVFGESNNYLSVWHMSEPVADAVGTLRSTDTGTTATPGVIGGARQFPGGKGIFCGDRIDNYPVGSASHSTEAWIRPRRPNGGVIGWGNEQAQEKIVMGYRSPPHVGIDGYLSDANVTGKTPIPAGEWAHVVHTYRKGDSRLYVNGVLDTARESAATPLSINSPARLWIGGWYNKYDFVGDIDEVRVSRVARSADWIRLQYENQKPLQTLVGPLVRPGEAFSVSEPEVTLAEGKSITLTAMAGGAWPAQNRWFWLVYWRSLLFHKVYLILLSEQAMTCEPTFRSPTRKLITFFLKSRDNWKAKHHQRKKQLKLMQNRCRSLLKSRDSWRQKAKDAEARILLLRHQLALGEKIGPDQA